MPEAEAPQPEPRQRRRVMEGSARTGIEHGGQDSLALRCRAPPLLDDPPGQGVPATVLQGTTPVIAVAPQRREVESGDEALGPLRLPTEPVLPMHLRSISVFANHF